MSAQGRIAVGLSGGVDSAVAAALLLREGQEVLGLTMKIWSGALAVKEGGKHACYGPGEDEDIAACQRMCARLGIEYRVVDLSAEYERRVLGYFREEYLRGRTPNPCVVCNRELKFGFLVDRAKEIGLGFGFFATGHYARIEEKEGVLRLRRALDPAKDQSYFLYSLGPSRLSTIRFPLGSLKKEEVRAEARALGLEVADKAESQDFIAGGDMAPLFKDEPPLPGDFIDEGGRVIGKHRGLPYYTIGQRRGLGVSLGPDPLYVLRIEPETNRILLGPGEGLFVEGLKASDYLSYSPEPELKPFEAMAKIRHNHKAAPCLVEPGKDGTCRVLFKSPERAVAPGQSVVLYDEEGFVIGGAIIEEAIGNVG